MTPRTPPIRMPVQVRRATALPLPPDDVAECRSVPVRATRRGSHVDLTFSDADEQFRTEFRGWLDENLPEEWRERGFWSRQDPDRAFELRRTWGADKAKAGFAGIQWPT